MGKTYDYTPNVILPGGKLLSLEVMAKVALVVLRLSLY